MVDIFTFGTNMLSECYLDGQKLIYKLQKPFDKLVNLKSVNTWFDFDKSDIKETAAKYMARQKNGRIIFITSGQSLMGVPLMAHYSAAKGGVISLAQALAAEWGKDNITVNTIAPVLRRRNT